MRSLTLAAAVLTGAWLGGVAVLSFQGASRPGHDRVPPYRDPAPYLSAADIQAALNKLDPALVASRTGGAISFAEGKAPGVVRRRMTRPQYAITHTRTLEYIIVTKGTGTLVTGGTLVPPTIDSDPYPNANPNATIRSASGVKGGLPRKVGPGRSDQRRAGLPRAQRSRHHDCRAWPGAPESLDARTYMSPSPGTR